MSETSTVVEFNYASFSMEPYKGDHGSSNNLLKNIIKKLTDHDFPNDERVIDRFENRKKSGRRKLVVISNRFEREGKRSFGKIALIKNKAPMLWGGKDIVEEIEKASNKEFIEITNYAIHFNSESDPVIMYEFNSEGPRLTDIEYYFRQIAQKYRLAKKINSIIHLTSDYSQLDSQMQNVFGLTVKVNFAFTNRFNWLKNLKGLRDDSGYKDVRLELFYRRVKENGKYKKNIKGTELARNIIGWLKQDRSNIQYLDDLKMTYQINEDEILSLDFIKNKITSYLEIPKHGEYIKPSDLKYIVGQEFNHFLNTGEALHSNINKKEA